MLLLVKSYHRYYRAADRMELKFMPSDDPVDVDESLAQLLLRDHPQKFSVFIPRTPLLPGGVPLIEGEFPEELSPPDVEAGAAAWEPGDNLVEVDPDSDGSGVGEVDPASTDHS